MNVIARGFSSTGSGACSAGPNIGGFHHGEEEEEGEDTEVISLISPSLLQNRGEFDTEADAGFGSTFAKIQRAGHVPALSHFAVVQPYLFTDPGTNS
jgi:hypothetical protein